MDAAVEEDASGLVLTPGFIDIHTHYDGQVTPRPARSADPPASRHSSSTGRAIFTGRKAPLASQVTWDPVLEASSSNGVTTCVIGNCGVAFAPCKKQDRAFLVDLMDAVEVRAAPSDRNRKPVPL